MYSSLQICGFWVSERNLLCLSDVNRFIAWNLGCGFAQSGAQLIVFRFLAGLGGSAPLVVRSCFSSYRHLSDGCLDWRGRPRRLLVSGGAWQSNGPLFTRSFTGSSNRTCGWCMDRPESHVAMGCKHLVNSSAKFDISQGM